MTQKSAGYRSTLRICLIGVMAAIAFVSNYLRIPFLDSKIHVGNAVCVLNGFIFGPWCGFAASGLGNLLYDLLNGYASECLITGVSKGAISLVSALVMSRAIAHKPQLTSADQVRVVIAGILGALTYVALYMLKTFIFGLTVNGLGMDGTLAKMALKLPASLINGTFAAIVAPIFYNALRPALRHNGVLAAFFGEGSKAQ